MARPKKTNPGAEVSGNAINSAAQRSQLKTTSKLQNLPKNIKHAVTQPSLISGLKKVPLPTSAAPTRAINHADNSLSSSSRILNIRKSIALLCMLTEAPQAPSILSKRRLQDNAVHSPGPYSLAFEEEKALVEAFTFLSSATVDPLKVSALCLEESSSGSHRRFTLKIAANHGDLVSVKSGLDNIIANLSNMHQGTSRNFDNVLRSVISLNYQKILCRLRSRHAKWSKSNYQKAKLGKAPLLPLVIQIYRKYSHDSEQLMGLRRQIDNLESLHLALEALPDAKQNIPNGAAMSILTDLLIAIHALWQSNEIQNLFEEKQNRWILLTLHKLARYAASCSFLLNEFKRHKDLTSMKVEVIRLEPFPLPQYQYKPGDLQSFASSIMPSTNSKTTIELVQRRERSCGGHNNHDLAFVDIVNSKCTVHAELQLLFHFELYPKLLPPRLIVSTKLPCYLCSLFFKIHGAYHIAETHGRLYGKWTLPQAITILDKKKAASVRDIMSMFQDGLTQSIKSATASTKPAKLASRESFFSPLALWASVRRIPNSKGTSQVVSRNASHVSSGGQSSKSASKHRSTSTTASSSQDTIKGQKVPIKHSTSQDTITPRKRRSRSGSVATHRSSLGDHANQPTYRLSSVGKGSESSYNKSPQVSQSLIANTSSSSSSAMSTSSSSSRYLRNGSSITLETTPNIRPGSIMPSSHKIQTSRLRVYFTPPSDRTPTQIRVRSLLSREFSAYQTSGDHRYLAQVNIATMRPGDEVQIDQRPQGATSRGFFVRWADERLLINCQTTPSLITSSVARSYRRLSQAQ